MVGKKKLQLSEYWRHKSRVVSLYGFIMSFNIRFLQVEFFVQWPYLIVLQVPYDAGHLSVPPHGHGDVGNGGQKLRPVSSSLSQEVVFNFQSGFKKLP